jgi:hypothetical protein
MAFRFRSLPPALALVALWGALAHAQPLPIPAPEMTASKLVEFADCQLQVSAWIDAHIVTLGVVVALALVGFFTVTLSLMRVVVGLGERVWEKRQQTRGRQG